MQRLGGLQRLLVPGLEGFDHDVEPASTGADDLLGRLGASGADRLKRRECAGNARVLAEVDIVLDEFQAALQLGQEQVDLEQQVLLALHDVADNRLSPRDKEGVSSSFCLLSVAALVGATGSGSRSSVFVVSEATRGREGSCNARHFG